MPQKTHGMSQSPEYKIWVYMIGRCHNPKRPEYPYYGGRGILVCDEWRDSFEAFYKEVGSRPSPRHTIDRLENSRNYEPGNVRWATKREQQQNLRSNRLLTHNGLTLCVGEWARRVGICKTTIYLRLKRGWPINLALEVKPRLGNRVHRGHGGEYEVQQTETAGAAF